MKKTLTKILITTSTFPASPDDPVPAFVRDQVLALKASHPELDIHVLSPHNAYGKTYPKIEHPEYTEYRFHYFWPHRLELLAGRGIAPALKAHKWLYMAVPFLFLFEGIATYRLAKKLRPDLLYVHWFTPQAITAAPVARRLRIPLVFTTHASDVAVLKKIPGAASLVVSVCRQAASYTAVSNQTADRLRYFWKNSTQKRLEQKLSIIPMGTDIKPMPASAGSDVYSGKKVILYVGRLVRRKGVFDLLNAYRQIIRTNPDTVLVIAGDGQEKSQLEAAVRQAGLQDTVIFPGYVTGQTKADLIHRADVLCLPSINEGAHAEGLPVVFMEGVAAGKIVVASDATGAQEYLQHQKDGFVYPEQNMAKLTETLNAALNLPDKDRERMQSAAEGLASNFSWDKVAAAHFAVLKDAYDRYDNSAA